MYAPHDRPEQLHTLDATQALGLMRSGQLSVTAYATACLARAQMRDSSIHAWKFLQADLVLARAHALDALAPALRGPLHGLPVGVKDVFLTQDMPTQYNSAIYKNFCAGVDAAAVALLRQAGAIVFGKTDTVEFASTGAPPPTRNPHDTQRTPGGSSSGSAAAVADMHVPLALGTQTGGSMIRPASFCGVYAIKPTWGLVSREGVKSFSPTLDTVGWFARSAEDLLLMLDVLDARVEPPPTVPLVGARIAVCRTPAWKSADAATANALAEAARLLRDAGAQVVDLELPPEFAQLLDLPSLIMRAEGGVSFLPEYRSHPELLHPNIHAQVEDLARSTPAELLKACDTAAACRSSFDSLVRGFDAVLTPSAVGEAPAGLASTGDMVFNGIWTLLHVPCINVPGLRGPAGLPVGVTLTGARYSERRVITVAGMLGKLMAPREVY